ncbi:MAG: thioesterase family protein [Actinomycetota bacterium]
MSFIVSDEMTVVFEELGSIHPLYATYWMAKHVEEASRKVLAPYFDPDEDGVGRSVSVTHHAPAAPGTEIHVHATHERTEGNRVFVSCAVTSASGELLGEGSTEQVVLPKTKVQKMIESSRNRSG